MLLKTSKVSLTLCLIIIVFLPSLVHARRAEITPFGGFMFGGNITTWGGDFNIVDNWNYGVALDVDMRPGIQIELLYNRLPTRAEFKPQPIGEKIDLFDMSAEYFHIGVLRALGRGRTVPFVVGSLGPVHLNPLDDNYRSEWFFSMGFGGGLKAYVNDRIGLRLQGRLWFPFDFVGGYFFWGTGGSNIGLSGYSLYVQGELSGGLTFAF